MKRYEDAVFDGDSYMREAADGQYALYTDAQAERADLLEALKGLLALEHARLELAVLDRGIGTSTANAAWLQARAAIAKAESHE